MNLSRIYSQRKKLQLMFNVYYASAFFNLTKQIRYELFAPKNTMCVSILL